MENNEENAAFGTSFNSSNEENRVQPTRTNLVEVAPQEFMSLESQPSTSKGLTEIPPNGCSTPLHTAPQPVPKITIAPMGKCSSANISLNDLQNSHNNEQQHVNRPANLTLSPNKGFAINFQTDNSPSDNNISLDPVMASPEPAFNNKQPASAPQFQPATPEELNASLRSHDSSALDPFSPSGPPALDDHPLNTSNNSELASSHHVQEQVLQPGGADESSLPQNPPPPPQNLNEYIKCFYKLSIMILYSFSILLGIFCLK